MYCPVSGKNKKRDLRADIRDRDKIKAPFKQCQPDLVFHLGRPASCAPQLRHSGRDHEANVMGTINVMEAIRARRACV